MGDWFINYELSHDRTTFAKIEGPSESDMCHNVTKGDSVIIKAYENDTSNLPFTKTVKISLCSQILLSIHLYGEVNYTAPSLQLAKVRVASHLPFP